MVNWLVGMLFIDATSDKIRNYDLILVLWKQSFKIIYYCLDL